MAELERFKSFTHRVRDLVQSEEDLKQAFRTADSAMYEEKLRTKSGRDMSGEEFQLKEAEV